MAKRRTELRSTLRDVARVAGLSITQTSRALNGHSDVAEATRRRALDAARQVGYHPNLEARRLKMPDALAQSIGLVLSSPDQRFSDPFLADLLTVIAAEAGVHEFELQLSTAADPGMVQTTYERAIVTKRVDGFILLRVAQDDHRIPFLLDRGFPFVTFSRPRGLHGFRSVSESADGLRPIVSHLLGLGHRALAAVALPPGFAHGDQRLDSFRSAMAAEDPTLDAHDVVVARGYHENDGAAATEALLARPRNKRPTAIVAFNDLLAMGALRAINAAGLAIPHDVALATIDDTIMARAVSPALTALRLPTDQIGQTLVRQLMAAMNEPGGDEDIVVEPTLIERESTAAVAHR